jgi:hypothetical protein
MLYLVDGSHLTRLLGPYDKAQMNTYFLRIFSIYAACYGKYKKYKKGESNEGVML